MSERLLHSSFLCCVYCGVIELSKWFPDVGALVAYSFFSIDLHANVNSVACFIGRYFGMSRRTFWLGVIASLDSARHGQCQTTQTQTVSGAQVTLQELHAHMIDDGKLHAGRHFYPNFVLNSGMRHRRSTRA